MAAGRDPSVASGVKPLWGYTAKGEPWVASCGAEGQPLGRVGDARLVVAITNKVVAICALSSMLLFVSPKASFESNWFSSAFGWHCSGGGGGYPLVREDPSLTGCLYRRGRPRGYCPWPGWYIRPPLGLDFFRTLFPELPTKASSSMRKLPF
jgi:hypothetical protein